MGCDLLPCRSDKQCVHRSDKVSLSRFLEYPHNVASVVL